MEPSEKVYRSRAKMMLDNFLGGIVWSVGVWVGSGVIIALLIYFLSKIDLVPIVGDFLGNVTSYMVKQNPVIRF
jgi:hypothetical protein